MNIEELYIEEYDDQDVVENLGNWLIEVFRDGKVAITVEIEGYTDELILSSNARAQLVRMLEASPDA